jgi:four helix bundle protein
MGDGSLQSFRELAAWQRAMDLAEETYAASAARPPEERFGLTQQLRRCAVSIPSNIAEGHRLTRLSFRRHLSIALGSLAELETQLELAVRLKLVQPHTVERCESLATESRRLLYGLLRSLLD